MKASDCCRKEMEGERGGNAGLGNTWLETSSFQTEIIVLNVSLLLKRAL